MWFIYILLCKDGSFYTGSSNDIQKRFLTHKDGKGGKYTRSHKPVKIIYSEQYPSRAEAMRREYQLKKLSKAEKKALVKEY